MERHVEILVGSTSDLPFLWESDLLSRLDEAGIKHNTSVCSAHRNVIELEEFMEQTMENAAVYVCAAGWAAALPGAVKAQLLGVSLAEVFGIALPSVEYPDGKDAEISIKRLPPGVDVTFGGVGTEGFNAIADQIIASAQGYDPANPDLEELAKVQDKIKPPWFNIPAPVCGKTKQIRPTVDPDVVEIFNTDNITAGDGAQHDVLPGKGIASTRTTSNIFALLESKGIKTHYLGRTGDRTFRARKVNMIPLELIVRRIAFGSYLDRFPDLVKGTRLDDLVFEVFEKDDANHDPLLEFDFEHDILRRFVPNNKAAEDRQDGKRAGELISEELLSTSRYAEVTPWVLGRLRSLALQSFEIIEAAFAAVGGTYFDYKIECGYDVATNEILVADVIDSDSGRLRFGEVDKSKESYRDGSQTLPEIKRNFDEVAELTDGFVPADA